MSSRRRHRRLRACAATAAVALSLGVLGSTAGTTLAAFTDDEHVQASIGTATLAPPQNLVCSKPSQFLFTWSPPTDPPPGITYFWSVSNGLGTATSGTISTTSQTVNPGALSLGTYDFTVQSRLGLWSSPTVRTQFTLLTTVLSRCGA